MKNDEIYLFVLNCTKIIAKLKHVKIFIYSYYINCSDRINGGSKKKVKDPGYNTRRVQ